MGKKQTKGDTVHCCLIYSMTQTYKLSIQWITHWWLQFSRFSLTNLVDTTRMLMYSLHRQIGKQY